MSLVHAAVRGSIVVLPLLWAGWAGAGEDADPVANRRPFDIQTEDNDVKVFVPTAKKPIKPADLLPAMPRALPKSLAKTELADVPEVGLEEALPRTGTKQEVLEQMEYRFATVNFFNLQKTDGFLHALLAQRPDLASLPFQMGASCRLAEDGATALGTAIGMVRSSGDALPNSEETLDEAMVAAMIQVHGTKEKQTDLARRLSAVSHVDATRALARLALFSPDAAARATAARGLKVRREQDYTGILLDGLRYPWPTVARRAVEAMVQLNRQDLLLPLVQALEAPDPRLAVKQAAGWQARELVRINHHRNCLLCHPPAHTKAVVHIPDRDEPKKTLQKILKEVAKLEELRKSNREHLLAPAPLPNRAFETGSDAYRGGRDRDHILVRVDVTYLRQDFSALLPVENAAPWPDFQRFDFLVRTRHLAETEATALREKLQPKNEGAVSPYHQAALFGLRELTGLEATTPADWRRLLKVPMP
jgi:hypothetical protein